MRRQACTLVVVLMMFAGSAVAQNDEAYIGYRQTLMEGIGSDMAVVVVWFLTNTQYVLACAITEKTALSTSPIF